MTKILAIALATTFAFFPVTAGAQQAAPDFSTCEKLRDESAYGKKYENFMYILPGKDGWLFRTKQDFVTRYEISDEAIAAYQQFAKVLKDKGTELVIAFAPTRGMAAAEYVPVGDPIAKGYDPAVARKNYADLIKRMRDAGINVVGTPEIKAGADYFYKADQHWTSAGAREMAEAVADAVKGTKAYKSVAKTRFVTVDDEETNFDGTFNDVLKVICERKTAQEKDTLTKTSPAESAADERALFSDQPTPQVILVGTSNSKKESNNVNFDGFLKEFLSADVYNGGISGGGIDDPFLAYLASDSYRKNQPSVIIWEIPGYYDLGHQETVSLLRQLIPAAQGDCGSEALAEASVTLDDKKVNLMRELDSKKLIPAESYISLTFDKPVKKKFSVSMKLSNNTRENFRFTRSKRYPHDGIFFYAPKGQDDAVLSSVDLSVQDAMKGMKVEAKLCRLPDAKKSWASSLFDKKEKKPAL